jgi:hypothetical protein
LHGLLNIQPIYEIRLNFAEGPRSSAADRVFRIAMALVRPPAGACRTGSVIPDAETDR